MRPLSAHGAGPGKTATKGVLPVVQNRPGEGGAVLEAVLNLMKTNTNTENEVPTPKFQGQNGKDHREASGTEAGPPTFIHQWVSIPPVGSAPWCLCRVSLYPSHQRSVSEGFFLHTRGSRSFFFTLPHL